MPGARRHGGSVEKIARSDLHQIDRSTFIARVAQENHRRSRVVNPEFLDQCGGLRPARVEQNHVVRAVDRPGEDFRQLPGDLNIGRRGPCVAVNELPKRLHPGWSVVHQENPHPPVA